MLRYWHVTLLAVIALIWKVRPTTATMDVCDVINTNVSMFCNCDPLSGDQLGLTCYVFGSIPPASDVWGDFRKYENAVALNFKSRLPYQLTYVPNRVLQSLPSLETFTVQEAKLGTLESRAISNMPKLKRLLLARNEISTLEKYSISDLPKLSEITLSENFITEILSDTFVNLDELELLFLDTNNISRIEGCAFCNLHNLKELELWRNSITDLTEHTFRGLRYLHRLDLFNNKLSVINENVFPAMPKLRELNLKNNMIHYISPRAFENMNHLTSLYLTNNHLKSLPGSLFQKVPTLMVLEVSHNRLETISTELMEGMRNKQNEFFTFYFRGNPIKCSCDLSWVPIFMKKSRSTTFVKELSQMTCLDSELKPKEIQAARLKECSRKNKKLLPPTVRPTVAVKLSKEVYEVKHMADSENREREEQSDVVKKQDQLEYTETITVHTALQESPGSGSLNSLNTALLCMTVVTCIRTSTYFWTF